jgi:hypothetical protein
MQTNSGAVIPRAIVDVGERRRQKARELALTAEWVEYHEPCRLRNRRNFEDLDALHEAAIQRYKRLADELASEYAEYETEAA